MLSSNKRFATIAAERQAKQRFWLAVMLFAVGVLLFSLLFGEANFFHVKKMKAVLKKAQQEVEALDEGNRRLLTEIEALRTDPFYIEQLARERLGLVKEGEKSYEFYNR